MSEKHKNTRYILIRPLAEAEKARVQALEQQCRNRNRVERAALADSERRERQQVAIRLRRAEPPGPSMIFDLDRLLWEVRVRMDQDRTVPGGDSTGTCGHTGSGPNPRPARPSAGRRISSWWFGMLAGLTMLVVALSTFAVSEARTRQKEWKARLARSHTRTAELERLRQKTASLKTKTRVGLELLARAAYRGPETHEGRTASGKPESPSIRTSRLARKARTRRPPARRVRPVKTTRPDCSPEDPLCGT